MNTADGFSQTADANESLADAKEKLRAHARVHWSRADLGDRRPARIVSLVPSLSEALSVLGFGERLVGVTDYCVHPFGAFDGLPKLGGTKDADVEAIGALRPDLVIANQEENTARVVRKLAERDIDVWVTYPRTVSEGADLLTDLASLGASAEATERHVAPVLSAVASAERAREVRMRDAMAGDTTGQEAGEEAGAKARGRAAPGRPGEPLAVPRPRVFCPIWRDPWMTIGRDTYIHDMIDLCGGENLCAEPFAGEANLAGSLASGAAGDRAGDRRYPIVDLDAVLAANPDVILLPDEPYAFDESDARRFSRTDTNAARSGRIHLIDGTLVSWYGPRIAEAIRVLAAIFANP